MKQKTTRIPEDLGQNICFIYTLACLHPCLTKDCLQLLRFFYSHIVKIIDVFRAIVPYLHTDRLQKKKNPVSWNIFIHKDL